SMSANSLCFKDAYEARINGKAKLEDLLRHVVAHYGGLRHETDAEDHRPYFPRSFETEVSDVVLSNNLQLLGDDDTAFIYSIFLNGFQGDVAAVRKLIDSSDLSSTYYLRPLMRIATNNGD
ncbi:hypothetical protein FB567DRAFT_402399, partial [Paraphoma chrysanthemicola]